MKTNLPRKNIRLHQICALATILTCSFQYSIAHEDGSHEHAHLKAESMHSINEFIEVDIAPTGEPNPIKGTKTIVKWELKKLKPFERFYDDYSEYKVSIFTTSRKPLSLYTLGIQGREHDVVITGKTANSEPFSIIYNFEKENPLVDSDAISEMSARSDGFIIPKCTNDDPSRTLVRPADESKIAFIQIPNGSCSFSLKSLRINHRDDFDFGNSVKKTGHNSLPPQVQSGGNN